MVSVTGHTEPVASSTALTATIASGMPSSMAGATAAAAAAPPQPLSPTSSSLSSLSLSSSSPNPLLSLFHSVAPPLAPAAASLSAAPLPPSAAPPPDPSLFSTINLIQHLLSLQLSPQNIAHLLSPPSSFSAVAPPAPSGAASAAASTLHGGAHGAPTNPPTSFSLSSLPPSHFLSHPAAPVAAAASTAAGSAAATSSAGAPPSGAYPPASVPFPLPPLHFNPHTHYPNPYTSPSLPNPPYTSTLLQNRPPLPPTFHFDPQTPHLSASLPNSPQIPPTFHFDPPTCSSSSVMPPLVASPSPSSSTLPNPQLMTTKLNSENFLLWKCQFETLLGSHDLLGYINGSIPCPSSHVLDFSGQLVHNPAYTSWFRTDRSIKSWMYATFTQDVLQIVYTLPTSRDIWLTLERRFVQLSLSKQLEYKSEFSNIKMRDLSCDAYLSKLKNNSVVTSLLSILLSLLVILLFKPSMASLLSIALWSPLSPYIPLSSPLMISEHNSFNLSNA